MGQVGLEILILRVEFVLQFFRKISSSLSRRAIDALHLNLKKFTG